MPTKFRTDLVSGRVVSEDQSITLGRDRNPGPFPLFSYAFTVGDDMNYFRATRQASADGKKLVVEIDYPHLRRALKRISVGDIDQMVTTLRQAVMAWEAAINAPLIKRGDWSVVVREEP